jgi:hypothetical protein
LCDILFPCEHFLNFASDLKFRYGMGTKKLWTQNEDLKFQRGLKNFRGATDPDEIVLAGSMTPAEI